MDRASRRRSPLKSLAEDRMERKSPMRSARREMHSHRDHDESSFYYQFWMVLFWFAVFLILTWYLLYVFKPDFVQKKDANDNVTGELDAARLFWISVLIALVITVIMWLWLYAYGMCW